MPKEIKMKQKMKKCLCLMLSFVFVLSNCGQLFAQNLTGKQKDRLGKVTEKERQEVTQFIKVSPEGELVRQEELEQIIKEAKQVKSTMPILSEEEIHEMLLSSEKYETFLNTSPTLPEFPVKNS